MPFTLNDDPQCYGLEMALSNILMTCFVQTTGWYFFLKQKNSYHSKHVRGHAFMTRTWKGGSYMSHVCADCFVFKQKIYCSF